MISGLCLVRRRRIWLHSVAQDFCWRGGCRLWRAVFPSLLVRRMDGGSSLGSRRATVVMSAWEVAICKQVFPSWSCKSRAESDMFCRSRSTTFGKGRGGFL